MQCTRPQALQLNHGKCLTFSQSDEQICAIDDCTANALFLRGIFPEKRQLPAFASRPSSSPPKAEKACALRKP